MVILILKTNTMIIVFHKSKMKESILKKYPDALIIDLTSKATDDFVKFSPFYPHNQIPIPFSEGHFGQSVEGIWQGLKVFETEDIDISKFNITNMKGLKRTVRKFGKCFGHRNGINGDFLLNYIDARKQIYLPIYHWVLENKLQSLIETLKSESQNRTLVLLDYETNGNVEDSSKPLSHAYLVKLFLEENYPHGN